MKITSKEFFEYEFDKVHKIGAADGGKLNAIVRLTNSHVDYTKHGKKTKNKKNGLKPSLTKKRTALLGNMTEKIEIDENYQIMPNSVL